MFPCYYEGGIHEVAVFRCVVRNLTLYSDLLSPSVHSFLMLPQIITEIVTALSPMVISPFPP